MKTTDILYISHGGGPLPLLGDPDHLEMVECLKAFAAKLPKPSAILVVSAHWEESLPTITSGAAPGLIYDYYGFPPESYEIEYPSPGEPALAQQVCEVLEAEGIKARMDERRGYDHGMFVPLKIMYPQADIPCIQLSLVSNLDAETHLAIGRALRAIDHDNLLVIGSGFSFHNMRAFFAPETVDIQTGNKGFESWLKDVCSSADIDEAERSNRLIQWEQAPYARFCHPREEHLLPLHVCYGMAGRPGIEYRSVRIARKDAGMVHWQLSK